MRTVQIIVKAGQTFRGIKHFEDKNHDASPRLAQHAVQLGAAEYKDPNFAALARDRHLVESIGDRFALNLEEAIGERFYEKVRQRNAKEPSRGVCHSHDFCDANEVMLGALAEHGLGKQFDAGDEGHCALWNAAWDYAAVNHLGRRAP